jgi:hypothetical protein
MAALALLQGDLEAHHQKCWEKAKDEDLVAIRPVLNKVLEGLSKPLSALS